MTKRLEGEGRSTGLSSTPSSDATHGGRSVNTGTVQLTRDQKVFKKLGLGDREYAHLDASLQIIQNIANGLQSRKFEPGWFKKILLWLGSLGGQQYKKAVKQFRMSQILKENGNGFLEDLGKGILLCDPGDLLVVCKAAYDLLAVAGSGTRKDFFINKLLLP
ncbi:MAG: hypothetical protein LBF25_02600, partial [Puniceicoccales bacterium]|nr:hypothetical protein [Puniceicoccales bacterium]